MKVGILAAIGFALLIGFPVVAGLAPDTDGDGTPDALDNCVTVANAGAAFCDTDTDGYGNACDGDFTQNFTVTSADFNNKFLPDLMLGMDMGTGTDMTCNNTVTSADFNNKFLPNLMVGMPGPSGLGCAGMAGCM
jgi:thrombospondin type 3 repeat protein